MKIPRNVFVFYKSENLRKFMLWNFRAMYLYSMKVKIYENSYYETSNNVNSMLWKFRFETSGYENVFYENSIDQKSFVNSSSGHFVRYYLVKSRRVF